VEREGIAPKGWTLIRDVTIDPVEDAAGEEGELSRLIPRTSNRLTLSGGLPMPRGSGVYLTEGDPDVLLPALPEGSPRLSIALDGTGLQPGLGSSLIQLASLEPPEGPHVIEIGSIRRRYSTIRTVGHASPRPQRVVGHEIRLKSGGVREPSSLDASGDPQLSADGARVIGSMVETGPSLDLGAAQSPLVLPRGAQRCVLIPAHPGPIESVEAPVEPPWMGRAGLECQSFEHFPEVEADWLLTEGKLHGWRARKIASSGAEARAATDEERRAWADAVLTCGVNCTNPEDQQDWLAMRALAEAIT
jgi:hypothetical protein